MSSFEGWLYFYIQKSLQEMTRTKFLFWRKTVLYARHLKETSEISSELYECGAEGHMWSSPTKTRVVRGKKRNDVEWVSSAGVAGNVVSHGEVQGARGTTDVLLRTHLCSPAPLHSSVDCVKPSPLAKSWHHGVNVVAVSNCEQIVIFPKWYFSSL